MRKLIAAALTLVVLTGFSAAKMPESRPIIYSQPVMPVLYTLPVAAAPAARGPSFAERAAAFKDQVVNDPDSHPFSGCGCTFTAEELDAMFLGGQVGYGATYVHLQQEYGICPLWNAAIDAAESGHFAHFCAPNNVAGFGFDGKRYMAFESIESCLEHKSRFLATHYLTPGGIYYKGNTLSGVCTHYNGSAYWQKLVLDVAYGMLVRGERCGSL